MKISNEIALVVPDMSVSGSSSIPLDANFIYRLSCQASITGASPGGTIKLQCSNDQGPGSGNNAGTFIPTDWSDIPNTTESISATGTVLIPSTEVCYRYIQVVYTTAGGSAGALTARVQSQGL
jgi:hypothetical protein